MPTKEETNSDTSNNHYGILEIFVALGLVATLCSGFLYAGHEAVSNVDIYCSKHGGTPIISNDQGFLTGRGMIGGSIRVSCQH
jgi:hypothetical protein